MPTKNIFIDRGYPGTGELELSDNGNTPADRTYKIQWHIRASEVASVENILPKPNAENIWTTKPHPVGNHWEGDISSTARYGAEHCYSIFWKTSGGREWEYDPKITIQPDRHNIHQLIAAIVSAILAFFTVRFFRSRK